MSEWEERHNEFAQEGELADIETCTRLASRLSNLFVKANNKRGFINSIFGKYSNGDLERISFAAHTLGSRINSLRFAESGSAERKELGQQIVYGRSLLNQHEDLIGEE